MRSFKKYYCIVFLYSTLSPALANLFDIHGEYLLLIAIPAGIFVYFLIDELWRK